MHTLTAIFSVLFGLAFGSFLNVCISRIPRGESVVTPRSRCPECGAKIRGFDNIPLVSWLLLRGRCRACKAAIPFRYFIVEALTAALFALCLFGFGLTFRGLGSAVLCFLLLGLAVMDLETLLLPDAFTLPGLVLGLLYSALSAQTSFGWRGYSRLSAVLLSAITAACAGTVIVLIRWCYWLFRRQEGMGLGDAKLLAMIGAWLGPAQTFLAFFLAVVTGAIYGLGLVLFTRYSKHSRGLLSTSLRAPLRVPLGAFLCVSSLYSLFWGQPTLTWYLSLMR